MRTCGKLATMANRWNRCDNVFERIDDDTARLVLLGTPRNRYRLEILIDAVDVQAVSMHTWHRHIPARACDSPRARASIDCVAVQLSVFLMAPAPGLVVDHLNRIPTDNRRSNLRCITQAENVRNTARCMKMSKQKADEVRMRLECGERVSDLARIFNVSQPMISRIKAGIVYA